MQNKIIDYRQLIERTTQGFVGRLWVREAIDTFLAADGPRTFLLLGEPGSGKTSFLADLVRQRGYPHHFIGKGSLTGVESSIDWRNPIRYAESIGYQLLRDYGGWIMDWESWGGIRVEQRVKDLEGLLVGAEIGELHGRYRPADGPALTVHQEIERFGPAAQAVGVYIENYKVDPKEVVRQLITIPLTRLVDRYPSKQFVLVVDGLDEVEEDSGKGADILHLLPRKETPTNVRMIVSSRPGTHLDEDFKAGCKSFWLSEDEHGNLDAEATRDAAAFVIQLAQEDSVASLLARKGKTPGELSSKVAAASQGNFLYLYHYARGLRDGNETLLDLDSLPAGLHGIYSDFLGKIRKAVDADPWSEYYKPLLGLLAVAYAPLQQEQLAFLSGILLGKVATVLLQMNQFLNITQRESDTRYALYHKSFGDFLVSKKNLDTIDGAEVHKRVIEKYRPNTGDWSQVKWTDLHDDNYGLMHLIDHLYALRSDPGCREQLYTLICVPYWRAKRKHTASDRSFAGDLSLADDISKAIVVSRTDTSNEGLRQTARLCLIFAHLTSEAAAIPPEMLGLMVLTGQLADAQFRARALPTNERRVASSLIAQACVAIGTPKKAVANLQTSQVSAEVASLDSWGFWQEFEDLGSWAPPKTTRWTKPRLASLVQETISTFPNVDRFENVVELEVVNSGVRIWAGRGEIGNVLELVGTVRDFIFATMLLLTAAKSLVDHARFDDIEPFLDGIRGYHLLTQTVVSAVLAMLAWKNERRELARRIARESSEAAATALRMLEDPAIRLDLLESIAVPLALTDQQEALSRWLRDSGEEAMLLAAKAVARFVVGEREAAAELAHQAADKADQALLMRQNGKDVSGMPSIDSVSSTPVTKSDFWTAPVKSVLENEVLEVAAVLRLVGDPRRAAELARTLPSGEAQCEAAKSMVDAGQLSEALRLAAPLEWPYRAEIIRSLIEKKHEAEALKLTEESDGRQAALDPEPLAVLAEAYASVDECDRACSMLEKLSDEAKDLFPLQLLGRLGLIPVDAERSFTAASKKSDALVFVVRNLANGGRYDELIKVVNSSTPRLPVQFRARVLWHAARALAAAGRVKVIAQVADQQTVTKMHEDWATERSNRQHKKRRGQILRSIPTRLGWIVAIVLLSLCPLSIVGIRENWHPRAAWIALATLAVLTFLAFLVALPFNILFVLSRQPWMPGGSTLTSLLNFMIGLLFPDFWKDLLQRVRLLPGRIIGWLKSLPIARRRALDLGAYKPEATERNYPVPIQVISERIGSQSQALALGAYKPKATERNYPVPIQVISKRIESRFQSSSVIDFESLLAGVENGPIQRSLLDLPGMPGWISVLPPITLRLVKHRQYDQARSIIQGCLDKARQRDPSTVRKVLEAFGRTIWVLDRGKTFRKIRRLDQEMGQWSPYWRR